MNLTNISKDVKLEGVGYKVVWHIPDLKGWEDVYYALYYNDPKRGGHFKEGTVCRATGVGYHLFKHLKDAERYKNSAHGVFKNLGIYNHPGLGVLMSDLKHLATLNLHIEFKVIKVGIADFKEAVYDHDIPIYLAQTIYIPKANELEEITNGNHQSKQHCPRYQEVLNLRITVQR